MINNNERIFILVGVKLGSKFPHAPCFTCVIFIQRITTILVSFWKAILKKTTSLVGVLTLSLLLYLINMDWLNHSVNSMPNKSQLDSRQVVHFFQFLGPITIVSWDEGIEMKAMKFVWIYGVFFVCVRERLLNENESSWLVKMYNNTLYKDLTFFSFFFCVHIWSNILNIFLGQYNIYIYNIYIFMNYVCSVHYKQEQDPMYLPNPK